MTRSRQSLGILVAFGLWAATAAVFGHGHTFSDDPLPDLRFSRPVTRPGTDRLVIILTDSVPFHMAFDRRLWPKLSALRQRATWGKLWTAEPTMTSVMINTILTGNWPTTWTVIRDWHMQKLPYETWVDGLVQSGRRVVAYGDIPWSEQVGDRLADSYTIAEEGKTSQGRPIHWESKLLDMSPRIVDAGIHAALQENYDVLVWHVVATDQVMHLAFRDSSMTKRVLRYADEKISALLDRLDDGKTTFLLLSDHGCAANGRHGTQDPDARPAYWMLLGRGVTAGLRLDARQQDMAPTILALFGLTPNAPAAGRVLWEALDDSWRDRALLADAAVRQRIEYLKAKQSRDNRGPSMGPWQARLATIETALKRGDYQGVCTASSRTMRQLSALSFAARRDNDTTEALAWWVALGLLLMMLLGAAADPPAISQARTAWLVGTALLALGGTLFASRYTVPLLVALSSLLWLAPSRKLLSIPRRTLIVVLSLFILYLVGVTELHLWTGRLCNSIIFQWTKNAESWFVWSVDGLALMGLAVLFVLRRRILPSLAKHPVAWIAAASLVLAGSNGYYQGFYVPFVFLLWILLLWQSKDSFPGETRLLRASRALGPLLAAAGLFYWQTTWDRHCFHLRYWLDAHESLGGLTAALAMLAATSAIAWNAPWFTKGSTASHRESHRPHLAHHWLLGLTAALLLAGLHTLFPTTPEQLSASLGAHLMEALPGQAVAMTLLTLVFVSIKGWRSHAAVLTYLTGLTALAGSPFEATVTGILLALTLSVATHPVFVGRFALPASVFTFIALRVALHILFDFKFNFTGIHDLMGFPAQVTSSVFFRTLLLGLVRFLPATLLSAALAFGRLDGRLRIQAISLALFFLASRILFILVLMHLSRFQLYLNWRNTGEALYYGIWMICLLVYGLTVLPTRLSRTPRPEQGPV